MTDDGLFTLIIAVLRAQLGSGPVIKRGGQSKTVGRPDSQALLLFKIGPDQRYGWVKREDVPDGTATLVHRETQKYLSRFQVTGLGDPNNETVTASDFCNLAAAAMQSDTALAMLRAEGVAIMRIEAVRNLMFRNDRDQYEDAPSFDFVLSHDQVIITGTPAAIVGEFRTARV